MFSNNVFTRGKVNMKEGELGLNDVFNQRSTRGKVNMKEGELGWIMFSIHVFSLSSNKGLG